MIKTEKRGEKDRSVLNRIKRESSDNLSFMAYSEKVRKNWS